MVTGRLGKCRFRFSRVRCVTRVSNASVFCLLQLRPVLTLRKFYTEQLFVLESMNMLWLS